MRRARARSWLALLAAALAAPAVAWAQVAYQPAPEPIATALEAPAPPTILLSPDRDRLAILSRPGLPSIAELAEPELGLAGHLINPRNNGPGRVLGYSGIRLVNIRAGQPLEVDLPAEARLIAAEWAPDGRNLAFLLLGDSAIQLWTVDSATGEASRRADVVNAAFPEAFTWFADGSALLVRLVPRGRGAPPEAPQLPSGPIVRVSGDTATSGQTLHNLLSSPHDEALFEHYFTSQLAVVGLDGSAPTSIGEPGLIVEATPSPDAHFILLRRLKRPYRHDLPASAFPEEIFVTDRDGRRIRTIADRAEGLRSLSALPPGPRAVSWRADAAASLFWAESADDDGPRDRLFLLDLPSAAPRSIADLDWRFQRMLWGRADFALAVGVSPQAQVEMRVAVDPRATNATRLLQRRPFRGGSNVGTLLEWTEGRLPLTADGSGLLVTLPDGLGKVDLNSGSVTSIWSERKSDQLFQPLDRAGESLLVWRESEALPPNLFVLDRRTGADRAVTRFTDSVPAYAGVQVRRLDYRRADGRPLHGTLYLPPGYDPETDGRLPLLIWAYPASVTGAPASESPAAAANRYHRPSGFADLPLLMTGRGYAVLEAGMPVVGDASNPPNDSHIPQIVANAEAAIATVEAHGVADRARVAIGGHSYGAGMVANLLAHSDLFRTGIALSGAYNRTLTPFGFQASERRSFWEAKSAYLAMSPLIHAERIDEPILLVHGTADLNSGTLPMQSERLFEAITGLGGDARLVLLPNEDHQYRARESLMHLMWEMDRWLALHLGAPSESQTR